MITPDESLVKYDNPVSIENTYSKSPKGRPLRVSPQQSISNPVPPPPKPKSASADASKQKNEILNSILPPREWMEENQLWMQHVSCAPCTRPDVIRLEEQLDIKLQKWLARETGICPVRRKLYSQCFDELIRQVTINDAERGLLLLRVRDEIQLTIVAYQTLYESSMASGIRKALQAKQGKADMEKTICDLEEEKEDLKKQLNKQRAIYETTEKTENETQQLEEKKLSEEIEFLKTTNKQLTNQLKENITPKLITPKP
ncbi:axonemal dynein light intermediate polypeptide 1 [Lycodopsis pacificus]